MRVLAGRVGRGRGLRPAFGKPIAQASGVIGTVGHQAFAWVADVEKRPGLPDCERCRAVSTKAVSAWIFVVRPPRMAPKA